MHTKSFVFAGEIVRVHHNSDWSGEAIINIGNAREFNLPAELFIEIARSLFSDKIREQLHEMIDQVKII